MVTILWLIGGCFIGLAGAKLILGILSFLGDIFDGILSFFFNSGD